MERNEVIKEYFDREVQDKKIPPLPHRTKKKPLRDYLVCAACITLALGVILSPGTYSREIPIEPLREEWNRASEIASLVHRETSNHLQNHQFHILGDTK